MRFKTQPPTGHIPFHCCSYPSLLLPYVCSPPHERGMPRPLVPLEALHACERARENAEAACAQGQASMVGDLKRCCMLV